MKKLICLAITLVLCMSQIMTAFATEDGFVPSITYKPNPEVVPVVDNDGKEHTGVVLNASGEIVDYVDDDCLNVTPVAYIWDENMTGDEKIYTLLEYVYNKLNSGEMKIPYEKHEANLDPANMVIRDIFDARWTCEEHGAMIEEEGILFEITFDLGVVADAEIFVMTFDEDTEEWDPIVKVVNNGDGTVTCTFEHLCVVEFSMPLGVVNVGSDAVQSSTNVFPWIIVLLIAVAGVMFIVIGKKKKKEQA